MVAKIIEDVGFDLVNKYNMSYSIIEWKTDLSGIVHGTNLDKIQGIFPIANRAARQLLLDVDPKETIMITPSVNVFYDKIYDYSTPVDLKSNKIIDIRQQADRSSMDSLRQTYSMHFDQFKKENDFIIEQNNGVKTLRFSKSLYPSGILLNQADSLTENGTWSAGSNAINLSLDSVNYISGSASIKFDISAGGTTAYIENSTFSSVDLSSISNNGAVFVWVYIPSTTIIQSVNLRWGSSVSDYYNRTVTTQHTGLFKEGWNLCRFDWSGSTQVGTPDDTEINYLRVTINYDGTATTGVRVDNIIAQIGQAFDIVYYSKYLFKDSDGNNKEKADDDSDTVNLDTDSYNLFLMKSAEFAIQQVKKQSPDLIYFQKEYDKNLVKYKKMYRSEVIKPAMTYYQMRNQQNRFKKLP